MAFDFSPVGLGLGAASSIYGLIAGSAAQKRAEERRNSIIQQMKDSNAREYLDVMTGNDRSLAARTGGLDAGLESTGRSLGAANAAAGVTNSSAVAGSLGLGAQGIQKALAEYALRNKAQEQGILHSGQNHILALEMGDAAGDLNYERDQNAGYQGAFGNLVKLAGGLSGTPGLPASRSIMDSGSPTSLGGGTSSADAGMITQPDTPNLPPLTLGMDPHTRVVNPLQSSLQALTQKNRKLLGAKDGRTMGPMINGMQGSGLPAIGM